jgi:NAD(P)-dependent dehydrogenase (short-subunit alcohol dehydrogenase family)
MRIGSRVDCYQQRRMGESADIAKAVRAIADGLLDYAAGQVLNLDGGFHMRGL